MCQSSYNNFNNHDNQDVDESRSDLLSEIKKFNGLKNWQQEVSRTQDKILEPDNSR